MRTIGLLVLLAATGSAALACGVAVPEVDSASAIGALALLTGAVLVIRGRRGR